MLDTLFSLLTRTDFQDARTGLLTFPAYIYTYPPDQEYAFRSAVKALKERLSRPNHFLDCLLINIYDEFLAYLQNRNLGGRDLMSFTLEKEPGNPERVQRRLQKHLLGNAFTEYLVQRIGAHQAQGRAGAHVYVLVYGFGSLFPYMRVNDLLTRFEPHIKDYKLIAFYPGEYRKARYHMFGVMPARHVYRASCLNELTG